MRGLFGLVGIVVALAIVGLVARKQMAVSGLVQSTTQVHADVPAYAASSPTNMVQQSQQLQQQVKKAVDAAMQERPVPDDK